MALDNVGPASDCLVECLRFSETISHAVAAIRVWGVLLFSWPSKETIGVADKDDAFSQEKISRFAFDFDLNTKPWIVSFLLYWDQQEAAYGEDVEASNDEQ